MSRTWKKVSVFSKKGLLQEKCQWKKSVFSAEKGNVFIKKSVEKGVKFAAVTVMGPIYDVKVPAPGSNSLCLVLFAFKTCKHVPWYIFIRSSYN